MLKIKAKQRIPGHGPLVEQLTTAKINPRKRIGMIRDIEFGDAQLLREPDDASELDDAARDELLSEVEDNEEDSDETI